MITALLFAYLIAGLKAVAYLLVIASGFRDSVPVPPHGALRLAPWLLLIAVVLESLR